MKNEKTLYENVKIEIVRFDQADILTASAGVNLPDLPLEEQSLM